MSEHDAPEAGNLSTDDELRRQLREQVLELAEYDKRKQDDGFWKQELKKEEQRRKAREKEEAALQRGSGSAPSAFSDLTTDILANLLASLTWLAAGAVVLAAIGGAFWLWRGMNAPEELSQPLAYNIGKGKSPNDALKIAAEEAGKSSGSAPNQPTPEQSAAAQAAAKQLKAGGAAGENGEGEGENESGQTQPPSGKPEGNQSQAKSQAKAGALKSSSQKKADAQKQAAKEQQAKKQKMNKQASQKSEAQAGAKEKRENATQKQKRLAQAKKPDAKQPATKKPDAKKSPDAKRAGQKPPTPPRMAALPRPEQPRSKSPSSTHRTAHSPQLMAQLKRLWHQGKSAKHNGNHVSAKNAWQQALKLCPGHPGFQSSINKLSVR